MITLFLKKTLVLFTGIICTMQYAMAQATTADPVVQVSPPVFGFYTKHLDCGGVAIRSSSVVDDRALIAAGQKINMMLANIPATRHNLAQWGVEIHIIGKDQPTSDLPEFRGQKVVSDVDKSGVTSNIDTRTRGMGGIYTSCGEESLLNLPGDRYAGSDICIHEFAHNIMYYGLNDSLQKRIQNQYRFALNKGLWKGACAAVDAGEYWAELSMWYFGGHGEFLKGAQIPAPGPDGLMKYDVEGYALLKAIYSGKLQPPIINISTAKQVQPGTLSGSDSKKAALMFVNNTPHKIKLFFIDFTGKARPYGIISPYNRAIQKTFISHVWKLTDENGKLMGYFSATTPNAIAIVN
ncbi:hypothetical protein [Mucilaginibacter sp. UR6-11]|uniref:VHL beta domain-containing protein n=1 Tax=Mucilaginibacter sp. UR6-11 TaxID=1435644 RepID=UPI001E46AB1B|nr:hypothetical protein [Mucilaginibacter sp. UR6-11]MCC8427139.1 hypothetical protein [Mucilaginibacter sp. UR6-11]